MKLQPIQIAAGGLLASAYTTMVFGAYVKAIGAGMACPDWGTCKDGQFLPFTTAEVAAEVSHRIAATSVVVFGLALLYLEFTKYREQRRLIFTTLLTAVIVGVQIALGALTIFTSLAPLIVTAHLATGTLVFGFSLVIALRVWRLPPSAVSSSETAAPAKEPDAAEGS
jgi:heme a synthase